MNNYTKYFDNCKAVFQGGGCKAIAYVGAYKEAYSRGVCFSELSGTSAGALIAAFIAAGAKPDYLEKVVLDLDFSKFIQDYSSANFLEKLFFKHFVLPKNKREWRKFFSVKMIKSKYGIFEINRLMAFVEEHLQKLTGVNQEITFKDLTPDLHIVSVDLYTHRVKTWNRYNTPNESVSKAVCASCAIPLFFRPIDNRYVDGGVLCNLPNFIFKDEPKYNKILSFRFASDGSEKKFGSFKEFLKSLFDSIVDGADNLHELISLESYDITIHVKTVSSIDFNSLTQDNKKSLIKCGENAAKEFFDKENVYSVNQKRFASKELKSIEQVYSLVAYLGYEKHSHIYIITPNTYWSWILFPTLLRWIENKAFITIYVPEKILQSQEQEESRRRMLKEIGCNIIYEEEQSDTFGFIFKNDDIVKAVMYQKKGSDDHFQGKFYCDNLDASMLNSWIASSKKAGEYLGPFELQIERTDPNTIIDLLRKDPIYCDAKMEFQDIEITDVVFMNPFIRALKYKQIGIMFDLYNKFEIDPFSPSSIIFPLNKKKSIIGPPVVELKNGKMFVIEGNTRLVYAYRHGMKKLNVLVVSNVEKALPCNENSVVSVDKVLLSDNKIEAKERYGKFEYALFRHIEERLHPYSTYMK